MKIKEKILDSSFSLFRDKGYQATGISEILQNASAYKKTLYDHFESKDDLGNEYLNHLAVQQNLVMLKMLDRSDSISDFIDKWVSFIVREQRNNSRKDCPIALFSGEISHLSQFDTARTNAIRKVIETIKVCVGKFDRNRKGEKLDSISLQLYLLYLGGLRLFSLTKDRKVIELMKSQMKDLFL
ncbi:TetR/AcrR family transcriptional regulator [Leptospira idonii]|uniref:TetR/AcrR family transcriptional regulator n=1 Tax=Leptospira idonii TaxID=1193500 RepID=A0A4R9LUM2_9LEPT|nr:TetR/AcrR family transcriptional regulator [Leptospira idonii]TGN17582.1 TetR/AcrR family transcriptional regulator [Leptospira idonii]